jgi:hypothetical protein
VDYYDIWQAKESTTGTYDWSTATEADSDLTTSPDVSIANPGQGTWEFAVVACESSFDLCGPLDASAPLTVAAPVPPAAPVIDTVVITASVQTAGAVTTAGSALVTYNEDVTCLTAAGADFTYSNSGAPEGALAGASCASASAMALTITFPETTGTTQDIVNVPGNGDTFTYTVPGTKTTADAVYAGTVILPAYAATQIVTDDGTGTSPLS